MFIAASFTIAKMRKQPRGPSIDEWIKSCGTFHNGILLGHKKEGTLTLCNNMDGTGEHYTKYNKPFRER